MPEFDQLIDYVIGEKARDDVIIRRNKEQDELV